MSQLLTSSESVDGSLSDPAALVDIIFQISAVSAISS